MTRIRDTLTGIAIAALMFAWMLVTAVEDLIAEDER